VIRKTVLVVGATGSIGSLAVEEAIRAGHAVRALVRSPGKARRLPPGAQAVIGDLTRPETLSGAVEGVDAVVFTHGSDGGGKVGAETVDYGGVRNVLAALGSRPARIALMTAIGVTNRTGDYNRRTEAHDWKRRSERLVRASGRPYTIVRPGWFDYNPPDEHRLVLLQGDKRQAGDPSDGAIARRQIAEVLVRSLTSPEAEGKTFELVATAGAAQQDVSPLFAALDPDPPGSLDAVHDTANMPPEEEPQRVRDDVDGVRSARPSGAESRGATGAPADPRHTRREAEVLGNAGYDRVAARECVEMAGVTVRRATPDDMAAVGALGALLVKEHHEFDPRRFLAAQDRTPADYASFLGKQLDGEATAVLVAEENRRVIGYSYAEIEGYDYMTLRGPAGILHDIIVEPGHRGRGVGRLLLEATLAYLSSQGAPRVVLSTAEQNEPAQRLFASMGFRRTMVEMTRELGG
jgi:uncharacterized protein YbjT (DUF2867 family)/ribosomal protein S18 acetylase RimI-like enzyme